MSFLPGLLSSAKTTYASLVGSQGMIPQEAAHTISVLSKRLFLVPVPAELVEPSDVSDAASEEDRHNSSQDRHAAVLALKSSAREWKQEVAKSASAGLVRCIGIAADVNAQMSDEEIRAVIETCAVLCESRQPTSHSSLKFQLSTNDGKHHLAKNETHSDKDRDQSQVDFLLSHADFLPKLIALLSHPSFFARLHALQLLFTITQQRPRQAQVAFCQPGACALLLSLLSSSSPTPKPDIYANTNSTHTSLINNEAILLLNDLASSAELQKLAVFEGAFESLLAIAKSGQDNSDSDDDNNSVSLSSISTHALRTIISLLNNNSSNQVSFRELQLTHNLVSLLGFSPSSLSTQTSSTNSFAFQFWSTPKILFINLVLIVSRLSFAGIKNQSFTQLTAGTNSAKSSNTIYRPNSRNIAAQELARAVIELSLASNAPPDVKANALLALSVLLPSSREIVDLLINSTVSPVEANKSTTTEEHALPKYVRWEPRSALIAIVGTALYSETTQLRASALQAFISLISSSPHISPSIMKDMSIAPQDHLDEDKAQTVGGLLLSAILEYPTQESSGKTFDANRVLFACAMLMALIQDNEPVKTLAYSFSVIHNQDASIDSAEDNNNLLQTIIGFIAMSARDTRDAYNRDLQNKNLTSLENDGVSQNNSEKQGSYQDWTRVQLAYLQLLSIWLADSPDSVKEFLTESANLQVLSDPVKEMIGVDPLISGISTFIIGICYEYNRAEDTPISRSSIYPIIHDEISIPWFNSRLKDLRSDERFRLTSPDFVKPFAMDSNNDEELETYSEFPVESSQTIWLQWTFAEYVKHNYLSIQRAILCEPSSGDNGKTELNSQQWKSVEGMRLNLSSAETEIELLKSEIVQIRETAEVKTLHAQNEAESFKSAVAILSSQVQELTNAHEVKYKELETNYNSKIESLDSLHKSIANGSKSQIKALQDQIKTITEALAMRQKESDDLLLLVDELTEKIARDKKRMQDLDLDLSDEELDQSSETKNSEQSSDVKDLLEEHVSP